MNLSAVKTIGTRLLGRNAARLAKHSPVILTTVGIAGVVTAGVLVARATLKLEPIVDDINIKKRDLAHNADATSKDLTRVYIHGAGKIVKLYALPISVGIFSIGCIVGGHKILTKRNFALAAAYKAAETTLSNYRGQIVEEFGEEKDHEIMRKVSSKELTTVEIDEDGNEKAVHKVTHDHSQYARFFDEYNHNWNGADNNLNLLFLKSVQNYANDRLLATGHIFLNEVYERLGFEHTSAGAIVGWAIEPGEDNYVDFGIFNKNSEAARDFVNGYEKSILLDFNVDGLIYDKI